MVSTMDRFLAYAADSEIFVDDGAVKIFRLATSRTCVRAWQAEFGVTLGGTPRASGTSPPAVTFTGAPTSGKTIAPRIEVQAGATTFRYTAQNTGTTALGGNWIESSVAIPLGGTYALKGALTGITAHFPNSTYAADNVYQGTCSAWTDLVASASASQADATMQPWIWVDTAGAPMLEFNNNHFLADASYTPPASVVTTPLFFWSVFQRDTFDAACAPWSVGASINHCIAIFDYSTSPQMAMNAQSTAGLNVSTGAGVGTRVRAETLFTGTTADRLKLGSTSATGQNAGTTTSGIGPFVVGANGTSNLLPFIGKVSDVILYTGGDLTAGELAAMSAAAVRLRTGVVT